jgi:hypothetical protein
MKDACIAGYSIPAVSTFASRLSSPRFQRRFVWISGLVLVVGGLAALIAFVWTGPKEKPVAFTPKPAQVTPKEKTVPFDPRAKEIGERFIETAVQRKNLEESYRLVAPSMRDGFTLEQWKTGRIPVIPYPADTSRAAPVKIDYSYKNKALLVVLLLPKHGVDMKPQTFLLGLSAFGRGKNRHWLVDYWAPFGAPKIPQG